MYRQQSTQDLPFWMTAKYAGNCSRCDGAIEPGNRIYWNPRVKKAYCAGCGKVMEQTGSHSSGARVFMEMNYVKQISRPD